MSGKWENIPGKGDSMDKDGGVYWCNRKAVAEKRDESLRGEPGQNGRKIKVMEGLEASLQGLDFILWMRHKSQEDLRRLSSSLQGVKWGRWNMRLLVFQLPPLGTRNIYLSP